MKINTVSVYGGEKGHQYFFKKEDGNYYGESGKELMEYLKQNNLQEERSILKVNMVSGGGEHCHQYFYRKKNGKYYNEQGNEITEYLKLVNSYKYFKVTDIR